MTRSLPLGLGFSAGLTAGRYLAFGVFWIALTDWALIRFGFTPAQSAQFQTLKGLRGVIYRLHLRIDLCAGAPDPVRDQPAHSGDGAAPG